MMLNHDHLLTRVFDKQAKKMIYFGDKFNNEYKFIGIDNKCLLVTSLSEDPFGNFVDILSYFEMDNLYIPMLCTAYKDCDNKLIYEHDIIKTPNMEYVVERYKGMFIGNYINDYYTLDDIITQLKSINVQIKISGNIHENLNPLKKEKDNDKRSTNSI